MPAAPYQRIIFRGVPYWKDASGSLYYYESATHPTMENRIKLGTEAEDISEGWETLCADRLREYRAVANARQRDGVAPDAKS
jgi:hypothetical protein